MAGVSRRRGSGDPEARGKRAVEAHGEAPVANHACNSHSSIVTAADERRHREGCGPAFQGFCFEGKPSRRRATLPLRIMPAWIGFASDRGHL